MSMKATSKVSSLWGQGKAGSIRVLATSGKQSKKTRLLRLRTSGWRKHMRQWFLF